MTRNTFKILPTALLISALLIGACSRDSAQPSPTPDETGVQIQLVWQPTPAAIGAAELRVTITDANNAPIAGAVVDVRGDMSHAGMAPVIREDVQTDANGIALVPFEWTMGGDWFVIVSATLPDGTSVERRFDLSVGSEPSGEMPMDMGSQLMPGVTEEAP